MFPVSAGTHVNDLFGMLGWRGSGLGMAMDQLTGNSIGVLQNMQDAFMETALGRGTGPIERRMYQLMSPMGMAGMAPFMGMPSPMSVYGTMAPFAAAGYGGLAGLNLATMPMMGMGAMGMGASPLGYLGGMQAAMMARSGAAMGMGMGMLGMGANPFTGFALSGFSNVLGMQGPAGPGFGLWDNSGPMGGRGFGSWNPYAMPGNINNTNPAYETAHQVQVAQVLADPSLTIEDKVTLMIMLIMNKMDKDIENQAQYINSIQQQQSQRGGGSTGGTATGTAGGKMGYGSGPYGATGMTGTAGQNSPAIDTETLKLKRMVDKRSQMFDMLRQIIDKYNQTAKGIIDSIGR